MTKLEKLKYKYTSSCMRKDATRLVKNIYIYKRLEINTKLYIVIYNIVFTCRNTVQSYPVDFSRIF